MRKSPVAVCVALALIVVLAGSAVAGPRVVIRGGGWGHGIGMSQYGAYGRALRGDGASKILRHYYSRTKVERRKTGRIRVGLLQGRSSTSVSSSAFRDGGGAIVFKVKGQNARLARGGTDANFRVEPSATGGMRLYKNGRLVRRDGKRVFGSPATPLVLRYESHGSLVRVDEKNTSYAYGRMEFGTYQSSCDSGFCLRLVVVLPMQKYLYGLGEVPASWPRAVLKAQAIAGRTYAYEKITRLGQHRYPCDCAVYDSVIDQAYTGDSKRTGSGSYWDDWKAAVDATNKRVVLHGGGPIQALYSSSSGGHTEHNENVWGGTALSYLRGVRDGPDDVDANPNHSWKVRLSWREFSNKLNAAYDVGNLKRFKLLKPFGVSGRVTVVKGTDRGGAKVIGSKKTVRESGWSLRSALDLRDSLFRVRYVYKRDGAPAVTGEFALALMRFDGLDGPLGLPTSRVERAEDGVRYQSFENGTLYAPRRGGRAFALWGPVAAVYEQMGAARSDCGSPTSDATGAGDRIVATFRRGAISWTESAGPVVACD